MKSIKKEEKRVKEIIKKHNIKLNDKFSIYNFIIVYIQGQSDYIKEQLEKGKKCQK